MRIRRYVVAVSLIVLSVQSNAESDAITVSPTLDLSYKRLQYTFLGGKFPTAILLSVSPTLNIGRGRWYVSLSHELPIESYEDTRLRTIGSDLYILDDKFEQVTSTLTVGYRISESWSVFGGYLKSRHEYSTADSSTTVGIAPSLSRYILEDDGVFVGAGYLFRTGGKSSISLSLAYGDLDSQLKVFTNQTTLSDRKTSSDGYSMSIVWSAPVTESLSLRAGARYTDYKMSGTPINQHSYYTYFMGLASYF